MSPLGFLCLDEACGRLRGDDEEGRGRIDYNEDRSVLAVRVLRKQVMDRGGALVALLAMLAITMQVGCGGSEGNSDRQAAFLGDGEAAGTEQSVSLPVMSFSLQPVHSSGQQLSFAFRTRTPTRSLVVEQHGAQVVTERRIALRTELGPLLVPDTLLRPGRYEVALQDYQGTEVSRSEFWIVAPDAKPTLEVGGQHFASGTPLPVAWRDGAGNRYDWIGVDEASATEKQSYLAWNYPTVRSSGEMQLSETSAREGWPLPPGRHPARMLLDDGGGLLAESAPFNIE